MSDNFLECNPFLNGKILFPAKLYIFSLNLILSGFEKKNSFSSPGKGYSQPEMENLSTSVSINFSCYDWNCNTQYNDQSFIDCP